MNVLKCLVGLVFINLVLACNDIDDPYSSSDSSSDSSSEDERPCCQSGEGHFHGFKYIGRSWLVERKKSSRFECFSWLWSRGHKVADEHGPRGCSEIK